jgi:signal transduction histidine kinase/FixJ family two-component response regulator
MILETKNEKQRLNALLSYQVLDTPADPEFDKITKLASYICNTPISLISLVDDKRQWFKANIGLKAKETTKDISFCQHTIMTDEIFQVKDTTVDPLFKDNPLVTGYPQIRFYAGVPLKTPSGYNIGTLCVIDTIPRELTEDQKAALSTLAKQVINNFELKMKVLELEKASKVKDEFFSNMNHEIRTPLNAIVGFTELLMRTKLSEDQRNMLKLVKSASDLLLSIVNDILDYSKIESGKLTLESELFDLKDCIFVIYELLKVKSNAKNINFELFLDNNLPKYVKGDKTRLSQILTNLLGNAIKFTNVGFVKLKVELLGKTKETVDIKFSVIDSGIGIAQDKLCKVFQRFEQAETSTTRSYGGTGLGLSISKSLIELHGGNLKLESTLGKGSDFHFSLKFNNPPIQELDLMKTAQIQKQKLKIVNKSILNNLNILLVEDTDVNVQLVKRVLESEGINLDVAGNGRISIDKLRMKKYDLILMDIQMPIMNGLEATEYIRKELKVDIPIIALTANASASEKEKCLSLKMNDYITKPFKSGELVGIILKHLTNMKKAKTVDIKLSLLRNSPSKRKGNSFKAVIYGAKDKLKNYLARVVVNKSSKGIVNSMKENNNNNNFEAVNIETFKDYCDNDEEFEKGLVKQFLKDFPVQIDNLKHSIQFENFNEIKSVSHKMKSSVALFGMTQTRHQLSTIEKFALVKDIKFITSTFNECVKSLEESIREISGYYI